jgi:hypothetical protein
MKIGAKSIIANTVAASGLALLLVACGGGDGGGSSTGTLDLAITDASVDDAEAVVVEFTGVQLQHAEGERIDYDYVDDVTGDPAPRQIDLLALTGGTTELLLDGVTITAGDYSWIRLKVNAERGVIDSYIDRISDGRHSLYVPSGAQSGLKLNRGFNVPEDGMASFTIDFDLRKSVHNPSGLKDDYILRPTLRLVDDNTAGALTGVVLDIGNDPDCDASMEYVGAVYVFDGTGVVDVGDVIDDIDGTDDPVTSAKVSMSNEGNYVYTVAFLPEGDYVIGFTCDADIDNPDVDADATDSADGPVDFVVGEDLVTIAAGKTTVHDFQVSAVP